MILFAQSLSLTLPLLLSGFALIFIIKQKLLTNLNIPLDHKLVYRNKRIWGDNKTYRGIFIHLVFSISVCIFLFVGRQSRISSFIHPVFNNSPLAVGLLYAVGYSFGELINSFIKRQMNILPGASTRSSYRSIQSILDLSDGIVVVAIGLYLFMEVNFFQVVTAAIMGILLHVATDKLMRQLSIKKHPQ